ncbi:MAG: permease-like cell division protein FtsX [Candidatus Peribacteraceae bacterium]
MLQGMTLLSQVIRRGVRRGFLNVIREQGWGMSLGSLFGVLLLGQMLLLLVFGVQTGLQLIREKTDLRLEILESATDIQIQDIIQNVRQLPYVDEVVYITRQQAYERQKQRDPELVSFLTKFGIENPFPETLGVRLKRLEDYPAFTQFLRQPVFTKTVDPNFLSQTTDQEQQIQRLAEAVGAARSILLLVVGLLVLVVLFVVIELVRRRVAAKREELFVEQLVGAGRFTIFLPFCTEMFCLLCVALLFSLAFTAGLVALLPIFLPALGAGGMFGVWSLATVAFLLAALPALLAIEFLVIVCVALLGTFIALQSRVSTAVLPLLANS